MSWVQQKNMVTKSQKNQVNDGTMGCKNANFLEGFGFKGKRKRACFGDPFLKKRQKKQYLICTRINTSLQLGKAMDHLKFAEPTKELCKTLVNSQSRMCRWNTWLGTINAMRDWCRKNAGKCEIDAGHMRPLWRVKKYKLPKQEKQSEGGNSSIKYSGSHYFGPI